jgi:hypothetical protein
MQSVPAPASCWLLGWVEEEGGKVWGERYDHYCEGRH